MIKKTYIKIYVTLDESNVPENICWSSKDGDILNKSCNSLMLSIWDNEKETIKIDLWNKKMLVSDMKKFFYQIFMSMGDTYKLATSDEELSKKIHEFGKTFLKISNLSNNKLK